MNLAVVNFQEGVQTNVFLSGLSGTPQQGGTGPPRRRLYVSSVALIFKVGAIYRDHGPGRDSSRGLEYRPQGYISLTNGAAPAAYT